MKSFDEILNEKLDVKKLDKSLIGKKLQAPDGSMVKAVNFDNKKGFQVEYEDGEIEWIKPDKLKIWK